MLLDVDKGLEKAINLRYKDAASNAGLNSTHK